MKISSWIFVFFIPFLLMSACAPRLYDLAYYNNLEKLQQGTLHILLPTYDDSALFLYNKYNQHKAVARIEKQLTAKRNIIEQAFLNHYNFTKVAFHDGYFEPLTTSDYILQEVVDVQTDENGNTEETTYFQIIDMDYNVVVSKIYLNFFNAAFAKKSVARLNKMLHADYQKGMALQSAP